jgi:putative toxin-antitoxin system antitoxin component (TIGR02293 family)
MTEVRKTSVSATSEADVAELVRFVRGLLGQHGGEAEMTPGVSFLIHVAPLSESAAIERGLPASAWQRLQNAGFNRDEIAGVVGNSAKTIRRKESRSEPLDVTEGDRTMRLLRIITEAVDAIGDAGKAMSWLRRPNPALSGKTPLETIVTEAGTALVRRALGVIAYGGVA